MRLVKVKDYPGLVRDLESGSILNLDDHETKKARARKETRKREKEEIETLKDDVKDIKQMLSSIVQNMGDQWPEK
jgi:hypothetical protein